jgi:hypothetical protein
VTGNEIMWETIKHMQMQPIQNTYIDITKEWKVYDEKTQRILRDAMRLAPVISLNDQNHCEIKLRSEGYDAKENDFKIGGKYFKQELDYEIQPLSLWERLSNSKFVLKQIRYAIRSGIGFIIKIWIAFWKYIVAFSLVVASVVLTDHHDIIYKIFNWIKNHI